MSLKSKICGLDQVSYSNSTLHSKFGVNEKKMLVTTQRDFFIKFEVKSLLTLCKSAYLSAPAPLADSSLLGLVEMA